MKNDILNIAMAASLYFLVPFAAFASTQMNQANTAAAAPQEEAVGADSTAAGAASPDVKQNVTTQQKAATPADAPVPDPSETTTVIVPEGMAPEGGDPDTSAVSMLEDSPTLAPSRDDGAGMGDRKTGGPTSKRALPPDH